MNKIEQVALVDNLRAQPAEPEWFEFKTGRLAPETLGEYLSALANSACLADQPRGYLIFGIDDKSHSVVGTKFDPYTAKGKGNQDLIIWLSTMLNPKVGFDCHIVEHPQGRLVLFEIRPARGQPVSFKSTAYVRVGSSNTKLSQHPEKEREIWRRHGSDWSAETVKDAKLEDLDPDALAKAREQFRVKHPAQADQVPEWDDLTFLNKARVLNRGAVTHTALLLLGRPESVALLSPAVAKISWILKDADNHEIDYEHFGPPFLLVGERLQRRIRNLTVRALPDGTLFPRELTQYDPWVIREALHNCIAHQDYSLRGRVTVVEFPDRVILTNSGDFLPGDVETVIQQDAPQTIYRNPFLADAMVELNLIDTQGGGIKRMFETQRQRSFPLPDYDLTKPTTVTVTLNGRILDQRYTRLLMERTDLGLREVMLLDRVQRRMPIKQEASRALRMAGLVEGRYPNLMVTSVIAKATGQIGKHIRDRGLDKRYYLELILALIHEHGSVARKDVDEALVSKLPDRLTDEQKRRKVHNLLQELRRAGEIVNHGTRKQPKWAFAKLDDS